MKKPNIKLNLFLITITLALTGCATNLTSAIKAYATTAEEQAIVMKLNLDNCLNQSDQALKDASCNAVKSSINAYQQSAAQLKTIKTTE